MSRGKIILGSLALFLAGGVVGALIALQFASEQMPPPGDPARMAELMRKRLRHDLSLTNEQSAAIEPAIHEMTSELSAFHRENFARIRPIIEKSDALIRAQLKPEQQTLFDKLIQQRPMLSEPPKEAP